MHSLETGIIVSIAAFFFFSFLTFTFLREINISNEIKGKINIEENAYKNDIDKKYSPEILNNIINVILEGGTDDVRESQK